MGHSYVDVTLGGKERGFWCSDGLLEVWAYRMYELLATTSDANLLAYREHLRIQATAGMNGCVSLTLDRLPADAQEELARQAERLSGLLTREPRLLAASELNAAGVGGSASTFMEDVPLEQVEKLSKLIAALLRGETGWGPGDKDALPGHWLYGDDERRSA